MTFAQWTPSGDETTKWKLDTENKYAGNGSGNFHLYKSGVYNFTLNAYLERTGISCTLFQMIVWVKTNITYSNPNNYIRNRIYHAGYGHLELQVNATDWEKFRVTMWYDSANNVKFGRIEKWIGNAWVQQGSDQNMGSGSPASDVIKLYANGKGYSNDTASNTFDCWWDEIEVIYG